MNKEVVNLILRETLRVQAQYRATLLAAKAAATQMQTSTINLNPTVIKQLHEATVRAGKDRVDTFTFQGHEFVVGYAEWLLEWASERFDLRGPLGQPLRYSARKMREDREALAS